MHILKRELKSNLKGLLIWSIAMIVLVVMMTTEYSAYDSNPEMADVLSSMPEAMLKAFSMENANLTTPSGFISLASFYFSVMLGVYGVLMGSGIISKEERDKTVEFFLTLPVSRVQVIWSKLWAAVILNTGLNLITVSSIIVTLWRYNLSQDFFSFLWKLFIGIWILQMIFLSMGMFLASFLKRYKSSGKISASLLMVLYVLNVITALNSKLDFLKYITPFKYFEANKILVNNTLEGKYIMLSIVIIFVGFGLTFILYPKRDLRL
ncbi:MAG: ABC transporter permease subunit [Clostridia bacterium]|nr:ABC transporter permease subunit [Clostridia bacterium]